MFVSVSKFFIKISNIVIVQLSINIFVFKEKHLYTKHEQFIITNIEKAIRHFYFKKLKIKIVETTIKNICVDSELSLYYYSIYKIDVNEVN